MIPGFACQTIIGEQKMWKNYFELLIATLIMKKIIIGPYHQATAHRLVSEGFGHPRYCAAVGKVFLP